MITAGTAQHDRRRRSGRWRMPWLAFATAVVFALGTLVFLAPTIANWFSQVEQANRITELGGEVGDLSTAARHRAIEEAQLYNSTLIGGAVVAAGERIPQSADEADRTRLDYAQLLRADSAGLMARIKIPVIGVDLPIYHGTADATLDEGVGHLEGTALPVGGLGTRAVLTAHRGLATSELFTNLDRVQLGDTFTIEVFGEVLTYRVASTEVVAPDDTKALYPEQHRDLVTLVTCTPLGINSHRILVTGERILPTPVKELEQAGAPPTVPGFPWWMLIVGAVMVLSALYVWLSGRPRRPRPDATAAPGTSAT